MYDIFLHYFVGPKWSHGSWISKLPVQSVDVNTDVVSSNPAQGKVYNIMW